ncbi:MAG: alpha/beta hydrolase family protein [Aureliella sp.]
MRRSERVEFPGHTGQMLSGIIDLPESTPVAACVFTHCFTCNKDLKAIVRISRGLSALGFAVLRYDLTGLGSSRGDFSLTNFSTNQEDLVAAVHFLEQRGLPPKFLIGHSFGAACSLSLCESLPSVLAAVSIAGPSDTQHLADLLDRMDPEIRVRGIGAVHIGGRDYAIRQQMLDDFRKHDLPATLRSISKPILLFHSPVDETLGYDHVLRIFGCLSQRSANDPEPPPASLMTIPGADHLLIRNPADLEFVTASIATWIQRCLSES